MGIKIKIGIIGGSGFYTMDGLENPQERPVDTPWGRPTAAIVEGTLAGVPVAMLARHGVGHTHAPAEVNYRANIWALKEVGVTHILAVTCCGSLREDISPGTFVLLDSFIDRTQGRKQTFYHRGEGGLPGVCHIPMEPAFCPRTKKVILEAGKELGFDIRPTGTMVTIEGPRFSSKAESKMFRQMGGDVINMTTVPEVVLAKEAGLAYASIALATDYDCWKEDNVVTTQAVLKVLAENISRVKQLIVKVLPKLTEGDWSATLEEYQETAKNSVIGGN